MTTLRQATIYNRALFFGTAGQTVAVTLSKNGGAFAAAAGAVTELTNGWYRIALTTVDTNTVGDLAYRCTAASGGPLNFVDDVVTRTLSTDVSLDGSGNVSIASSIKKNQVLNGFTFVMTSSTSHAAAPGLSVTAQRSLGGAGFAPCANGVTELSNGCYVINLAGSDLNANAVMLRFTAAGADDLDIELLTQP